MFPAWLLVVFLLLLAPSALARERPSCPESININTADIDQFRCLKGIGKKRAEALLQYREEHGPYPTPLSIAAVVGEKLALRLRSRLRVGN